MRAYNLPIWAVGAASASLLLSPLLLNFASTSFPSLLFPLTPFSPTPARFHLTSPTVHHVDGRLAPDSAARARGRGGQVTGGQPGPSMAQRLTTGCQARELSWLLVQVQQRLQSLKAGLDECAALLARREDAATTLVLTSVRSEAVKGVITRCGDGIVKGVRILWPSSPCSR